MAPDVFKNQLTSMAPSLIWAAAILIAGLLTGPQSAQASVLDVKIAFLSQKAELPPALSNLDVTPEDIALRGARIGIGDNNTTGKFLKQKFSLEEKVVPATGDVAEAFNSIRAGGTDILILDLPAKALDKVRTLPSARNALLVNIRAGDDRFRKTDCHPYLLHTLPSRAMRTDALAQYLITKRWKDWFLVVGPRPEDELYAKAVRHSARKFGAKIVEEKKWSGKHDARRTAQAEVPLFTQNIDFDILLVADEIGDFGDFLMYRTWTPRPVAGTQGLTANAWGRPVEQWGAAQLQERFHKTAGRWMESRDYAAWAGIRTIGEAVTRTKTSDVNKLKQYIYSDAFQLAAFKGRKLSFRKWNGQLRMPVAVMTARSLVAQPPLKGFLHQRTELDTLGIDKPESRCGN